MEMKQIEGGVTAAKGFEAAGAEAEVKYKGRKDVALIMDSVNTYLICVGIFFIPLAIVNIYRNGIQGLGYGLLPMMAGVAELVGRGVVAVIAAGQKSYLGVCLASPAAWVLASLLLIGMYYYVVKIDLKKIFPDKYAGNKKKSGLRSR